MIEFWITSGVFVLVVVAWAVRDDHRRRWQTKRLTRWFDDQMDGRS